MEFSCAGCDTIRRLRNPTLTVQALAWRTADHWIKNWKTIAGYAG